MTMSAKEIEKFFKELGLGEEEDRAKFKNFDSTMEQPNLEYRTEVTKDTN